MTARNPIEERLWRHFVLHFISQYAHGTECLADIGGKISGIFYANSGGRIADKLEIVSAIGAGVNFVDVVAASDRRIVVTNAGGVNAVDVAEFAFGL
jgi:lactate dehydrogenase-like 2-hydroxyacid dehydrogenase